MFIKKSKLKAFVVITIAFLAVVSAQVINLQSPDQDIILTLSSNVTNFTELQDTPASYAGEGSNCVLVNAGETALEFGACAVGAGDITDVLGDNFITNGSSSGKVQLRFNATLMNATIDARASGLGDNSSWNQSFANTLYATIIWGYNQTIPAISLINNSWNQTFADTLYASIIWGYNQTRDSGKIGNPNYLFNDSTTMFFNDTQLNLTIDARSVGNLSWNQTTAEALFAPIIWGYNQTIPALNAINDSWNESRADLLYAAIIWGHNQTIDSGKIGNPNYLFNDSTTMFFNDTLLNITIDARSVGNLSWNQTTAEGFFLNLSGTNANQDINISPFNLQVNNLTFDSHIIIDNYTISLQDSNSFVNGDVLTISFRESAGTIPDFILQPGGAGQGNVITRSFIIADDNHSILGTTNQTDCRAWTNSVGEVLQIDCNTTSADNPLGSGADLLLLGDIQILGETWLRDSDGEWKFLSRDLELRDEFYEDIFFNELQTSTVLTDTYLFDDIEGENFVINIDENETILNRSSDNITLTLGTAASPILNFVHYTNINSPLLASVGAQPSGVAEVARILMGGSGNVYSSLSGITTNEGFFRRLFGFAIDIGPIYVTGLDITANETDVDFGTGNVSILLDRRELNTVNRTAGFFLVQNNGTYLESSSLEDIIEYADGGSISNNRYYNIIAGVIHVDVSTSRLFFVVQSTPSSEYVNLADAEVDQFEASNFFPNVKQLKDTYIPVARLIVKKQAGADEFQQLSNELFFFDERGITSKAGASVSPSITDHGQLTGLDDDDHTQYILVNGSRNFTGNIEGDANITVQGRICGIPDCSTWIILNETGVFIQG